MVRSMYSGVSGLRTHQTRMDTIGNNIANVNTYGFKSARTTFRDIYYQNMKNASKPTTGQGGSNPSQVGYGTQVGSVDLMMGRSTFSMTDQTMDVAIDGDGFIQVQDGAGNIYYTRAGMLNFDAVGNLVDMQGNYVLGVNGDPTGRAPGSERITVNLPNVQPTPASLTTTINGKEFTISASNNTKEGNINFNFTSDTTLPDGVPATASLSSTGIVVTFNANMTFNTMGDVNTAINNAIREANGGKDHIAGEFNVDYSGDPANAPQFPLKGSELVSTDYGTQYGSISIPASSTYDFLGMRLTGKVGAEFSQDATAITSMTVAFNGDPTNTTTPPTNATVSVVINGQTYSYVVDNNMTSSGTTRLQNGANAADYIEVTRPKFQSLIDSAAAAGVTGTYNATPPAGVTITSSAESKNIGLSAKALTLAGGTEGGTQGLADMTGIAISPNGIIVGLDSQGTEVYIGRIDIATFANQAGLTQSGSSYYTQSQNSGLPKLTAPGEEGAGKLVGGTLELSNVDLSREFSDMITTQRGYQANSRIITVSDTMLEELINLKR